MTGMSDRVCVDLCSLMKPGILSPSVLVGSFARGLFLVHSQSNYIATRPFAVNTEVKLATYQQGRLHPHNVVGVPGPQ
ncbi:putative 3-dehydroquinate synthase II [Helianthus anomalus]